MAKCKLKEPIEVNQFIIQGFDSVEKAFEWYKESGKKSRAEHIDMSSYYRWLKPDFKGGNDAAYLAICIIVNEAGNKSLERLRKNDEAIDEVAKAQEKEGRAVNGDGKAINFVSYDDTIINEEGFRLIDFRIFGKYPLIRKPKRSAPVRLPPPNYEGRGWLKNWLNERKSLRNEGYIVILAPPGFGKTGFFEWYLSDTTLDSEDRVQRYLDKTITPDRVIDGITDELLGQHTAEGASHTDSHDAVTRLSNALQEISGAKKKNFIYIDSVHESVMSDGLTMIDFLPYPIPGVVFVVSSRPAFFDNWDPSKADFADFIDIAESSEGNHDLLKFAEKRLAKIDMPNATLYAQKITDMAQGCFGVAKHLLKQKTELIKDFLDHQSSSTMGFDGYIATLWKKDVLPLAVDEQRVMMYICGIIHISQVSLQKKNVREIIEFGLKEELFPESEYLKSKIKSQNINIESIQSKIDSWIQYAKVKGQGNIGLRFELRSFSWTVF